MAIYVVTLNGKIIGAFTNLGDAEHWTEVLGEGADLVVTYLQTPAMLSGV